MSVAKAVYSVPWTPAYRIKSRYAGSWTVYMRNKVILLELLLACGTAQSSEWKELGGNTDGSHTVSIDVSSIRFEGAVRLAWFKHQYAPSANMHDKSGPDRDKLWSYSKVRYGFNCTNETYQMDSNTIVYFMDGSSGSD